MSITPTSGSSGPMTIVRNSALGELETAAAATSTFSISTLTYFPSFNAFFLQCLSIPAASSAPLCSNWTYKVNGVAPSDALDKHLINNGDTLMLSFGIKVQAKNVTATTTQDTATTTTLIATSNDGGSLTYATTTSPSHGTLGVIASGGKVTYTPSTGFIGSDSFTYTASEVHGTTITSKPATTTIVVVDPAQQTSTATVQASGGGGGGGFQHIPFNVLNAITYLGSQQATNGTLNNSALDTDWAALAYSAYGATNASRKLADYLRTNSPILVPITDYERHAMALEAMGINPYTGSPNDTITPIINAFDGTQIGDPTLVNDDIFALFPLLHAGYSSNDPIIQKVTAFILSRQSSGGSWGGVDMTAAAVQALAMVKTLPGTTDALLRARAYLSNAQQSNGGFGNDFSTSWAMQAIIALGEQQTNWIPSSYDPQDYLAQIQQSDGGMESASHDAMIRTWATAYAIPAVLGKTWDSLLRSFAKPAAAGGNNVTGSAAPSASPTIATSTLSIATSTPSVATSTLQIQPAASLTPVRTDTPAQSENSPRLQLEKKVQAPATKNVIAVKSSTVPATTAPRSENQIAGAATIPTVGIFFKELWTSFISFFHRWL